VILGCSNEPQSPPRFQIDPQQATQEAMRIYDQNGDGVLDAKELSASPPLAELLQNLKARTPGHPDSLNAADIQSRLEEWLKAPTVLIASTVTVYLDGAMLEGATVTYEPEPFLGSSYRSHQGQTNSAGAAVLDPDLKEFPDSIYVGLYRVRISKKVDGKETIPAKYNTETELGREIAAGIRNSRANTRFSLESK